MERGCGTIPSGSMPLFRSRRSNSTNSLFPRGSGRRTQNRRRFVGVRAQDRNSQQQQLDLSVLRIPGLDESYLPRYIGLGFGSLILLNHFSSSSSSNVTPAQLRSEALGICLAAFSTALPYLGKFLKLIAVGDVLCVRGYWNMTEDVPKAHMVEWFKGKE
ncbi:putative protein COFACTOR ASSEMBLY OF COMPLEX C SUBUNIT B CCB2, chloroplastic [Cocos nucifera]|uniref:Uncharacterized protein n=1 Tax=Cocos nucifera TaxID=13894 RepID=A0A8K0IMC6_COCNU|nr:putative protein COFACTOR ASSEMBLY OF COMPLEX C SUBUNIT B CCB2, chloroplastic [Cocos nucifera]